MVTQLSRKGAVKIVGTFLCIILSLTFSSPASAMNIEFTNTGANQTQIDAFEEAVQRWEYWLKDPITVNIDFSFAALDPGIIGSTSFSQYLVDFNTVKGQLNLDITSSADVDAVAYVNSLPMSGSSLLWYSNDVLGGSDSLYGHPDILGSSANLKALGYTGFSGSDADIEFNTAFSFDYDPNDGISLGMMDFVGVATHEVGHALGFSSIVDMNAFNNGVVGPPTIFDLYRHTETYGFNNIDIGFDGRDAQFSHDGGVTVIDLSDGANSPDGYQASHWANDIPVLGVLGIMDPAVSTGELVSINSNDLLAFDVIGWNIVPEPMSMLFYGAGLLGLAVLRKKEKE